MYINKKEYEKLENKVTEQENNMVAWEIKENLKVHPIINKIFSHDGDFRDFTREVIVKKEDFIIYSKVEKNFNSMFKIPERFKDHDYWIKCNNHIEPLVGNFTAFISFPYIDFEIFEREAKELGLFWDIYIVNPLLMSYNSAIGVFISLNNVNSLNSYVEGKTGYPLLFEYTNDNCDMIEYREYKPSFEEFKKISIKDDYTYKIMLERMFDFWHINDNVSWDELKNSYHRYCENVSFWVINDINIGRLKCEGGFRLVNTRTGHLSPVLKELEFDLAFDCYYDGRLGSEVKLSDEDLQDLREGNFELQICTTKEGI